MTGSCRHTTGASWQIAQREPSEGTWAMDWTVKGIQERPPTAWAAPQRLWWDAGRAGLALQPPAAPSTGCGRRPVLAPRGLGTALQRSRRLASPIRPRRPGPRRAGWPWSSSLRWRRVDRWRAGAGRWRRAVNAAGGGPISAAPSRAAAALQSTERRWAAPASGPPRWAPAAPRAPQPSTGDTMRLSQGAKGKEQSACRTRTHGNTRRSEPLGGRSGG